MICDCEVIKNDCLKAGYMKILFRAPEIVKKAMPGQFVHVQIPGLADRILRRPFSLCSIDREHGILTVLYKVIGKGTSVLAAVQPGTVCSIMGPQGNSFPMPAENEFPILIDGGFGAAATLPLAELSPVKGVLLLGARSEGDVILLDEYKAANTEVRIATQDGSLGMKGLVTDLLPEALSAAGPKTPVIYSCGPMPMLIALGKIAEKQNIKAYLSLDERMCCGVGACFGCVVRVKAENPDGWRYSRSCKEGPVYTAKEVYYGC